MKKTIALALLALVCLTASAQKNGPQKPWDNGPLRVSDNGRYLVHENGTPFFWLGETAWLLTSRLQREEIDLYLKNRAAKGFNVIQVSVFHYFPQYNVYGECATPYGYDFKRINQEGRYGYWDHVDYAIDAAARKGMYVAIVCTWGSEVVRGGHMNAQEAAKYGKFLAERYKDKPNIIWVIGGDCPADGQEDIWNALARSIKSVDKNHLMTYHPVGRRCSDQWFHHEDWLDFNMFQSGHRRYGQNFGQLFGYGIEQGTEEDNWRYVEEAYTREPAKPVIDGEPSYEGIPQGLRSGDEPYWTAADIRRYAYWSVLAGSFGHTYGDNAVMQFYIPSIVPSFYPLLTWWEALDEPASFQMQYVKKLLCAFPFTEGRPDQSLIVGEVGEKYDHLRAFRGEDFALVYTYTNRPITLDLDKLAGRRKKVFWYIPEDGTYHYVGQFAGQPCFTPEGPRENGRDKVLVVFDAAKTYVELSAEDQEKVAAAAKADSDKQVEAKAAEWAASLGLDDERKQARVTRVIATHQKAIRDWHNEHLNDVPKGAIDPVTGKTYSDLQRQIIADSAIPASVRQALLDGLRADLTEEQVEAILDKHTVGKVEFTMKAYREIVPDMTAEDEAFLYQNLKEARLRSMDFKNMKEISAMFEIYKTINEQHFTETGRDWRTMYKAYVAKLNEQKAKKQ